MRRYLLLFISLLVSVTSWAQDYVPGEVIVRLRPNSQAKTAQTFVGKVQIQKSMRMKKAWTELNAYHFSLKPGQSVEEAIAQLKNDPDVAYVEPNYILTKSQVGPEGHLMAMAEARQAALSQSGSVSSSVYGWSVGSASTLRPIVAVIDTGADIDHEVFDEADAIWTNSGEIAGNHIDDDHNGYVDDVHGWNFINNTANMNDGDGHGTHVSGIILDVDQDIFASPLAQSRIRIMPLKFLDDNGSGTTSDAIEAIYYAVNNGAHVLNNSWGGGSYSMALHEAIVYSYQQGRVFVSAAGNSGTNNDNRPMYPASYGVPNNISVAASTSLDYLASFSNFGRSSVHLASPGVSVLSTWPNDRYSYSSGTSMAAPFVSGIAALMIREKPGMNGYQVKSLLFGSSDSLGQLSGKVYTGSRVNASNAVGAASAATVDSYQPSYTISASSSDRELASELASGGGCGLVSKLATNGLQDDGSQPPMAPIGFVLVLLALPVAYLAWTYFAHPRNRRRFSRYKIDSQVTISVGDKELVGHVSSISLGGVAIDADALIENGGIVHMTIKSPDGEHQVEVDGHVVWSQNQKKYGVQFNSVHETVLNEIARWTRQLIPFK